MPRYIDADALKDVIQQHDYPLADRLNSVDNGMFTLGIFQAIDKMPTVSPDEARGVGKWIEKEVYNLEVTTIEQMQSASCSVCGKIHTTPFSYYFSKYNYCPNCGAKMEASEDAHKN